MHTSPWRILFFALALSAVSGFGCEDRARIEREASWLATKEFIERQLQQPSNFAGPDREPFTRDFYVPGLRQAKDELDKLETGDVKTVPVAAFVRPIGSGNYVLWLMWLQADDALQTVVLRDKQGVLVQFTVPAGPPEARPDNVKQEVVELANEPPHDGAPAKAPDVLVIRVERQPDSDSLQLLIRAALQGEEQAGRLIDVPVLEQIQLRN